MTNLAQNSDNNKLFNIIIKRFLDTVKVVLHNGSNVEVGTAASPLYVSGAGSGAGPLPVGAATEAKQDAEIALLTTIEGNQLANNHDVKANLQIGNAAVTTSNPVPIMPPLLGYHSVRENTTTPTDYTITCTAANTEYSQTLPTTCYGYEFMNRSLHDCRWSFTTGKVATPTAPYNTLLAGGTEFERSVVLASKTLYFASATAGDIIELRAWS